MNMPGATRGGSRDDHKRLPGKDAPACCRSEQGIPARRPAGLRCHSRLAGSGADRRLPDLRHPLRQTARRANERPGRAGPDLLPGGRPQGRLRRGEEARPDAQLRVAALAADRAIEEGSGHWQMERRRPRRISHRLGFDRPRHRGRLSLLGSQQLDEHHRPGRHARRDRLPHPAGPGEEPADGSRPHAAAHGRWRQDRRPRSRAAAVQLPLQRWQASGC